MNANPKSTREEAPAGKAEAPDALVTSLAGTVHKAVERYADLHKSALDAMSQQVADMNQAWRNTFRNMPGMFVMDMAEEAMGNLVEAEKNILDVMVKQSAHVADLTRERADSVSKAEDMAKDLLNKTAERTIAVHRIALDLAAEQNRTVAQAVKRQAGVAGTPMATAAETIEKNVGSVIDTQKEILDVAGRPLKAAARA